MKQVTPQKSDRVLPPVSYTHLSLRTIQKIDLKTEIAIQKASISPDDHFTVELKSGLKIDIEG